MNGDTAPMEYAGDLKFGLPEGGVIEPSEPLETWLKNARAEFLDSRLILPVLNNSDEQLEQMIREGELPLEFWLGLIESCQATEARYKAGIDVLGTAVGRLIVVLERIQGREATEAAYAERH